MAATNPPDPSDDHKKAIYNRSVKKGGGVKKFTELRSEYHDQKAIFTNILYSKVEGHFTPTYITFPNVPNTATTYSDMAAGPGNTGNLTTTGHDGIFYVLKGAIQFHDLAGQLPQVLNANQQSVDQDFWASPWGNFHLGRSQIFSQ